MKHTNIEIVVQDFFSVMAYVKLQIITLFNTYKYLKLKELLYLIRNYLYFLQNSAFLF